MIWREHMPLRDVAWFRTGGVSTAYAACPDVASVLAAVTEAKMQSLLFRVIGAGSGLLMSDSGFPGLIVHNQSQSLVFIHDRSQVIVDAGMPLHQLLAQTLSQGYGGLEFLAGIPGTVGGAVYGNVTAFGSQFGDYVKSATLLFPETTGDEAIQRVEGAWFEFGYRESKLKRYRQTRDSAFEPVVLTVTLQLSKMNHASCVHRVQGFHNLRRAAGLPSDIHPLLEVFDCLRWAHKQSEVSHLTHPRHLDQPVHFVDKSLHKQWKLNDVVVASDNPNYIINTKVGTSRDAALLIEKVCTTSGLDIEPTIEFVGVWQ